MDAAWADHWKRLGEANRRAHVERLRRLTIEEAIRQFEEHSRVRTGVEVPRIRRVHPLVLAQVWGAR